MALIALVACSYLRAGEINKIKEHECVVYELSQGTTVAKIAPSAGANVFSIEVDGVEYLHQPPSADRLAGVGCGVPILYPTPNRVKDATFTFEDTKVDFEANARNNFIHGLVNRLDWKVVKQTETETSASIECLADFSGDSDLANRFPFEHQLILRIEVGDRRVRWTYTVDNSDGKGKVPFGFALHPYFVYQGARAQAYLTINATHWMESSSDRLPSGKLVAANELDYSVKTPISLEETKFDDVFLGMKSSAPAKIEFRDTAQVVTIRASEQFTHLVVWTPDRTFFGIESQTCSTDAHNLFSAGLKKEAHLQICAPGQKMSGWVQYEFSNE